MLMPKRSRSQGGFTLIELMIVVAIIGVLAVIAVPNFIAYQARSRRSEAYANLAGIARAYKAYDAEQGGFPDMLTVMGTLSLPPGVVGTSKLPWDAATKTFFDTVGFQPEGSVFYSYDVNSNPANGCACTSCFTATAHGDVDGDGFVGAVMYVHPQRDVLGNVVGECSDGVWGYSAPVRDGVSVYDEPAVYYGAADEF